MSVPAFIDTLLSAASRDLTLAGGQMLFGTGDAVRNLYVVREGCVRLERHQGDGSRVVLQRASGSEMLAEASLFASRYHCAAIADVKSTVAVVPKPSAMRLRESPGWMTDFAAHLAHQVQRARARAELLSLRTVAERLDAWQALHGHGLPARGRWNEVAQEIGVSPEALYRELARRREGGALLGSGKRSN